MNGQKKTPPPARPNSLNANFSLTTEPLSNWQLFQNSLIFIYLNSGYRWRWSHFAELLRHLSYVLHSLFSFLQSKLSQTRCESILFAFWPSCVVRFVLALTFQFDLNFRTKIFANLTAIWKTRGLTKQGNEIINHHGNSVTSKNHLRNL